MTLGCGVFRCNIKTVKKACHQIFELDEYRSLRNLCNLLRCSCCNWLWGLTTCSWSCNRFQGLLWMWNRGFGHNIWWQWQRFIPSTEEIERCLLLLESTESTTIDGLGGPRKVVTAASSSSDGGPESRVWSRTVQAAEEAFQPLADVPGWITWKWSQYFHPDFWSSFKNSLLGFADFYKDLV